MSRDRRSWWRLLLVPLVTVAAAAAPPAPAPVESAASGALRFVEVARAWGLDFRHHHGGSGELYMPETMGSGVVLFDYDDDGDIDVLFVDSGPLPGYQGETPRTILYRNDSIPGRTAFVDAGAIGIDVRGYGMGGTAGDVDADGDLDLYVTAFGPNQLFLNRGDGTFAEAPDAAGAGDELWGSSAAFGDVDGDGWLDLYVVNYVDFTLDNNIPCGLKERGLRSYCHPNVYGPLPDRFYRNRGAGRFEDATESSGIAPALGNGLGVVFSDLDQDGDLDIYVANDMTPNFQLENDGSGRFTDVALLAGTALSERGQPEAGMGVDAGDLDGDGWPDLMTTHLDRQSNAIYGNAGSAGFVDRRYMSQLANVSMPKVGFGLVMADLDQDADLDIVVANGHIIHNVEQYDSSTTYKQQNQVFVNRGGGVFEEDAAAGLDVVEASRGLAAGDLDGDGDLDLAINDSNTVAEVYENRSEPIGSWLAVTLRDPGSANRFAIGARIVASAGGARQLREVRTASSYQSQSPIGAHLGLGAEQRVERLEIRWPDGRRLALASLPVDRRVRVVAPVGQGSP